MTGIPVQTRLDTLLVLAKDNESKRKEFYEMLLQAHLYTIGTLEAEENATQGTLKLSYFQGEGRWILPIFTQLAFLQKTMKEDMPVVRVRGKELFTAVDSEATVVLNIGTEIDKTFTPEEVKDIASGKIYSYYK
ncbi:SseB family protein [Microbacteriaceae bacterium 4G12]